MRPGDDLGAIVADAVAGTARAGDVLAVTQKIVSKAEGRLVPEGDPRIDAEVRRVVARRDELTIAETPHGFVCANAGADRSNVPDGLVSLLPEDPDASAERIRTAVSRAAGVDIGVVVTDTFGRPWRRGLVDVAIGCAGLPALVDLRGTRDAAGRTLETTVVALADEVAAAAGLATAKDAHVPVVIVRGLTPARKAGAARELVRPPEEDLFRWSPLEAISTRRTVRSFRDAAIPRRAILDAVRAALTAPVPHGSRHRARPWTWVILERGATRARLLAEIGAAWERDLREDGVPPGTVAQRRGRSDALLGAAPVVAVPALRLDAADDYADARRQAAEREMFLLATGAAVQNFMLALHAQGYGSCWVSSTLFAKPETRHALGLEDGWLPMGAIAAGVPDEPPPPRPPVDPGPYIRTP